MSLPDEPNKKPGLAPNHKALAEKIGIWFAAALLVWIVISIMTVGSILIVRWLF